MCLKYIYSISCIYVFFIEKQRKQVRDFIFEKENGDKKSYKKNVLLPFTLVSELMASNGKTLEE